MPRITDTAKSADTRQATFAELADEEQFQLLPGGVVYTKADEKSYRTWPGIVITPRKPFGTVYRIT